MNRRLFHVLLLRICTVIWFGTLTARLESVPPPQHYAIPFTKQDEFESAWPHLLKADLVLLARADGMPFTE